MTIRMLQAWNGLTSQSVVTLTGSEESRLVSLGYATFDLDGPTTVSAVANPRVRRTRLKFSSSAGTVGATSQTKRMIMVLRNMGFTHVVPHLVNSSPNAKRYIGSVMCTGETGDGHLSAQFAASQQRFKIGGYDVPLVSGENSDGYGDLQCDAIKLPSIESMGQTVLGWQTTCLDNDGSRYFIGSGASSGAAASDLATKGFMSAKKNGADWVTDPMSYVGSSPTFADDAPPVYFEFYGIGQTHIICIFDASTGLGKQNLNSLGLFHLVGNTLTTSEECVVIENYSVSGRRSADSLAAFKAALLRGVSMHTAVLPICTTNDYQDPDWGTPAYVDRIDGQMMEAIRLARINSIDLKWRTSQASTGLTDTDGKQQYTMLKAANQRGRDIAMREITALTGRNAIVEVELRCNNVNASVAEWLDPTDTDDGLHMNEKKQKAMVPLVAEDIRPKKSALKVQTDLNAALSLSYTGKVNKTLGDSRLANGFSLSASAAAAAASTSLTQLSEGDQYSTWGAPQYVAQFLSGGLFSVDEYAVSGSRVHPVAGRSDDVKTFQLPAALVTGTFGSDLGTLLVTANDRAAAPVNTVADTLASYRYVVEQWCSTGRRLEILLEPPQRGAYWPANAPNDWAALVALQRELAASYPGLISLVDAQSPLSVAVGVVYPAGDVKDPYYDDVHSKFRGSFLVGKAMHEARLARGWLPEKPIRSAISIWTNRLAGNKLTNALMTGTGGTGTGGGTAPTSWALTRTASNSWDKTAVWDGVPTVWAAATAYALGDRVVSPTYPDYDYLCVTAGTSSGSIPALSQTALATTADNTVTWLTVPKCPDLYGVNCALAYGVGTADNTREVLIQDVTIAAVGLAVGDTVEGSLFMAALKGFCGAQVELQAMAAAVKVKSSFGLLANYQDTSSALADGTVGRLASVPFVIPATTTILRLKAQSYSKNGLTQAFLFGAPELRKITT